ncbi:response regulator transcription factor [Cohnella hashimotonis]|uniref:Response regulator transcription factor n=1 Tax=Cohnella hashimotonis TaxID=2826895 RepID=A0ABT6THR2_9BACL|nr:response regulator transcription factor [Cohnella hashimotonis]
MSQINRVLLAEPSQEHRERIKYLLELDPLFEVVGETDCGRDAISLAGSLKPEVALVAVEFHDMKGTQTIQEMKKLNPQMVVVLQAESADVEYFFEALKSGAQGYLLKSLHPASFHEYLRSLLIEDATLPRELGYQILKQFVTENMPHGAEPLLSVMETAVLRNLCRGFNIEEIADRLVIPENTVKFILNDILFKLKLKNRTELVTYASDKGIFMSKVSSKKVSRNH